MADEDEVKATPAEDVEDEDLDAMLKKKKKKKKTKDVEHSEESLAGTSSAPEVEKGIISPAWHRTDAHACARSGYRN
jgi:hypothetical protein